MEGPASESPASNGSLKEVEVSETPSLEELERRHILAVLSEVEGNRTQAASVLGISPRTLRNKIALYREQGVSIGGSD
jgi:DNA-binding NtrC family response regulator